MVVVLALVVLLLYPCCGRSPAVVMLLAPDEPCGEAIGGSR